MSTYFLIGWIGEFKTGPPCIRPSLSVLVIQLYYTKYVHV